jgi:ketosteroid isomerase-like protein
MCEAPDVLKGGIYDFQDIIKGVSCIPGQAISPTEKKETSMNTKIALMALAGMTAAASVGAQERLASVNPIAEQAQAPAEADLLNRTKARVQQYLAAYAAGDAHTLSEVLTSDATFEFAADAPGVYRTIDASVLIEGSNHADASRAVQSVSNLEVYPTPNENTAFVHYDLGAGTPSYERHIVLVEMRGDRISRIRDFVTVR